MGVDAKRLVQLLDERAARDTAASTAVEFNRPDWQPRSEEEIIADIQAIFDNA